MADDHKLYVAVLREAAVSAKMIGNGVTLLRKVMPGQSGTLSACLFNLSIGLERAGKLAFVVDFAVENAGRLPTDNHLRSFHHNVRSLYKHVLEIAARRFTDANRPLIPNNPIHDAIVQTLSDFASVTRYYNLDLLVQGRSATLASPEESWFQNVGEKILQKHYTDQKRAKDAAIATNFGNVLDQSGTVIRIMDSRGGWIQSATELIQHEQQVEIIQKFAQFYTLQIVRIFAETLMRLEFTANSARLEFVPAFSELFAIFLNKDAYFRRRSTWLV